MKYRTFGNTGLELSVLSFGGSPLGGAYGAQSEQTVIDSVHDAIKAGINYFDTAPFYGATRSETVLGKALSSIPRDKYILATKVSRFGEADFDFSSARVFTSVEESLKRLQVDYIDVIQVHDIEFGDVNQVIKETLPALRKLKEAGKVRHIGVTGLQLKALTQVVESTPIDMMLSYCHYTLQNNNLEAKLLPTLKAKNIGVVNASIMSMGLLTVDGPPAWHPAPAEIKETCKKAALHCQANGKSLPELALKYALSNEQIATNLIGMMNPAQVAENVKYVDELDNYDKGLLKEVQEILKPVHNQMWASGRPENN